MSIISEARALLAVLQPLTGPRATGNVTVNAVPGPTAVLPDNVYGAPIMGGSIRYDRLIKTKVNPASKAGWTVGTATAVPVVSNVGGGDQNLPAGTQVRWFPTVSGIEPVSLVANGGTVGATGPGSALDGLSQILFFEEIEQANVGPGFWKGMLARFPGAVLCWEGSTPGDNQSISPLRQEGARVGRGRRLQQQEWSLYIVVSRQDASPARSQQGLTILDSATNLLTDRQGVDGFHFSSPTGVHITSRKRWVVSPELYVYRIEFSTITTMSMKDGRTFNPWLKARVDAKTTDTPAYPLVVDNEVTMPQ